MTYQGQDIVQAELSTKVDNLGLIPDRGLWSLLDMLELDAANFMKLGEMLYDLTVIFDWDEMAPIDADSGVRKLKAKAVDSIQRQFKIMVELARLLRLPASVAILESCLPEEDKCPQTQAEFSRIVQIFRKELSQKKALFIPHHLQGYYKNENAVSAEVQTRFPKASDEIEKSGTALAVGLPTASVVHAMRAAEIGLRSMHSAFPLTLKGNKPLELAEWRDILDALSNVARDIENRPAADLTRLADQDFVSEASAQFRFFKNGWRVKAAHARETFDEDQAIQALEHVKSFFAVLATRLTEI